MRLSARSSVLLVALTTGMLAACQPSSPPAQEPAAPVTATPQVTADTSQQPARSTDSPATGASTAAPAVSPAAFADKVWKVKSSGAVEPDTVYAFLGDGTLVIDSPSGTPMHGKWTFENGKLTMVEEGIAYPTDILRLGANELHLRSHNPGQPVDIVLIAAPDEVLPGATPEK